MQSQHNQSLFKNFLLSNRKYHDKLSEIVSNNIASSSSSNYGGTSSDSGINRLIINMNDFRNFDHRSSQQIQQQPLNYLYDFEIALHEYININFPKFFEESPNAEIHLGFDGELGDNNHVSPRHLLANYANQLLCLSGIITKCSSVIEKVMRVIYYCPDTNKFHETDFTSDANLGAGASNLNFQDANGNVLETEFGLSQFCDTQTLFIQEAPENAPAGQLPRSVECIVEDDLVDKVKPGDRVTMYGVYKALPPSGQSQTKLSSKMRMVFIVNHIVTRELQTQQEEFSENEIVNITKLSKRSDLFDILSRGMAPTIFGHDFIKKSLLLQMLGGVEKNFSTSNTHLRGDINILLVGDPSTAKSQMLRFVLKSVPLAISTTGRASTGVGLTAAVVADRDTGERSLQAGAMVLADRGIVCVDEFDKMSDQDRTAMHEVMEQQTVTIQKAGVHCSLNARCSVLAAANPIYGQYNRQVSIQRNIGLPDSLLSRFDLIYILLDERNGEKDRLVGSHVLNVHRQQSQDYHTSKVGISTETHLTELDEMNSFFNEIEKISHENDDYSKKHQHLIIPLSFLKKYVKYAKQTTPRLTEEAREFMHIKYLELRTNNGQKTLPITARTLESLIRLSTAHAKMRLGTEITKSDVESAFKLMYYSIWFLNNTNSDAILAQLSSVEGESKKKKKKPLTLTNTEQSDESTTATTNKRGREEFENEPIDEEEAIEIIKKAIFENAQNGFAIEEMETLLCAGENASLPKSQLQKVLKDLEDQTFCIIDGEKVFYCGE
ncbi:predicted protein [Naegleria gruberi]|uniref:DNA replication licensing factor MCM3 n=1 Tax=Naegleria gruberi TaxID=5762 RepID=D2VGW1_NAEGR|nr:uncharacterized protein NAEGRDRAFT_36839 [Naegleria gruberi]EFC44132.1 predicted protein [Naegleria gruberi]|eukprot:XP_002676876.1 predicted protein [Naegleria gruberi strain NEG-M]